MTVAQLRDRIAGMEATTRAKQAEADSKALVTYYPGQKRPRVEGSVARHARAAKLTAYRAELARREAGQKATDPAVAIADAAAIRRAAAIQSATTTAAQDREDLAKRAAERAQRAREASDAEYARLEARAAAVVKAAAEELASPPALVLCKRCGRMLPQDADGDMIAHRAINLTPCPAKPTDWTRPSAAALARHAEHTELRAEVDKRKARENDDTPQAAAEAQAEADAIAAGAAIVKRGKPRTDDARLTIPCPECHAVAGARCHNYKGQNCHPHGRRRLDPTAAAPPSPTPAASQANRHTPTQAAAAELSALDRAVEALVREYGSGAVIDAAWSAAHRIFRPMSGDTADARGCPAHGDNR